MAIRFECLSPLTLRSTIILQTGETSRWNLANPLPGTIRWSANYFYNDADLTVPGAYDISLEIAGTPADVDEGVAFSGIVRTPPAHLVRITPVGEDALVWKRLRQVANGKWPSHGFGSRAAKENVAAEVIARHSDSGYFPYAVVLNPSDPPLSVVRDALSRFPDSPAYPHALITAALVADTAGGYAANKAAAADAERYMQLAVSFCDEAAMTKNIAVTDQARAVREHATFIVSRLHDASRQLPKK